MTTVFNKIHRLKQQPGWTWDHFLTEIQLRFSTGLDEKTLYSHYRQPHKKPATRTIKIINQLHEQYFPDPFPEDINRLMRLYNNLVKCKKHLTKDKDIEDLEYFASEQINKERNDDFLRVARLNWLLGNIYFDRIPYHRNNGQRQQLEHIKQQAIVYYQSSLNSIDQYNQENPNQRVEESHLYKARHNVLACYLNAVPKEQRSSAPDVIKYLKESNYIPNSKRTLAAEPFQWSIARNGLRFSSLVKNAEDVRCFFNALVAVSDRFLDLSYEPLNYSSISDGADFQWAINKVLKYECLDNLKKSKDKGQECA